MAVSSEKYIVKLEADNLKLIKKLDQSEKRVKKFDSQVKRSSKAIKGAFGSIGKSFAAPLAIAGIAALTKKQLDFADSVSKLSTRLGASTEALSQYRFVAERSGVTFETLTMGWQRMTRRVAEAANGTGEAKGALQELGLSATKLASLKPEQQFEAIADALQGIGSQGERVRLAMKIFDSEGVKLLQTMEGGAAGIRKLRKEADSLGLTIGSDMAKDAARANDAITNMTASFDALWLKVTSKVSPAIENIGKTFSWLRMVISDVFDDDDNQRYAELMADKQRIKPLAENAASPRAKKGFEKRLKAIDKEMQEIQARIKKRWEKSADALKDGAKGAGDVLEKSTDASIDKLTKFVDQAKALRDKLSGGTDFKGKDSLANLELLKGKADAAYRQGNQKDGLKYQQQAASMIERLYEAGEFTAGYLETQLGLVEKLSAKVGEIKNAEMPEVKAEIVPEMGDFENNVNAQIAQVKPDPLLVPIKFIMPKGEYGEPVFSDQKSVDKQGTKL